MVSDWIRSDQRGRVGVHMCELVCLYVSVCVCVHMCTYVCLHVCILGLPLQRGMQRWALRDEPMWAAGCLAPKRAQWSSQDGGSRVIGGQPPRPWSLRAVHAPPLRQHISPCTNHLLFLPSPSVPSHPALHFPTLQTTLQRQRLGLAVPGKDGGEVLGQAWGWRGWPRSSPLSTCWCHTPVFRPGTPQEERGCCWE